MNKDIEFGSVVKLSPDTKWPLGHFNPLDCTGVVVSIAGWIAVQWDNGGYNEYRGDDRNNFV